MALWLKRLSKISIFILLIHIYMPRFEIYLAVPIVPPSHTCGILQNDSSLGPKWLMTVAVGERVLCLHTFIQSSRLWCDSFYQLGEHFRSFRIFFRLARRSGTRRSLNRFSARDHWKQFCIILINFSEASLRRAVNETSGSIIRKAGENMNWPPLSSPTHSVTDSRLARSRWLLQYPSNLDHLHRLRRRERDLSCGQENLINFRFSPLRYKLHSHRTTFQMIHLLQKAKSSPIIVPVVHSVYCSSEVLWGKKLHMKINILVSSSRQWVSMP